MIQANGSLSPRNKFAKRHYEAIATAIQEARRNVNDSNDPIAVVIDEDGSQRSQPTNAPKLYVVVRLGRLWLRLPKASTFSHTTIARLGRNDEAA